MRPKQLYFLLISAVVVLGLGFIGIGYGANALLAKQSANLATEKANAQALDDEQNVLAKDKHDIAKYSELNTIAESIVPQDKDQAEAVQQIVNLASQSGISKLSSITFPASTLGAVGTNSALTQVLPVQGISGVYTLQITVTQAAANKIPYTTFISFLQKLEQNRRTAQVTGLNIDPDAVNPNMVAFTLTLDEYIKP